MSRADDSLRNGISTAMARIKREFYGKGPARVRTYMFDDVIFAVLDDVLTPVEQTLKDGGREDLVRRTRLTFQRIMTEGFTGEVQKLTGARVIAYHSLIVFDPDMAIEIFVLDRPAQASARRHDGQVRAAIADAMARLTREHWGKGPTRAKAYIEDQFVFGVLEDPLTTVERTLIGGGESQLVRDLRLAFQELTNAEFAREVEQATGRRVLAAHSQVVFDPDILFVVFALEPSVTATNSS